MWKTNFTAISGTFYFKYFVYLVVERLKFNDKINIETKATVTPTTVIVVVVVVVVVMLLQSYTCLPLKYEVPGMVFKCDNLNPSVSVLYLLMC